MALPSTLTPSRMRLIIGLACYTISMAFFQAMGIGPQPAGDHLAQIYATLGFILGMFTLIYVPMTNDTRPARYMGLYLLVLACMVWAEPHLTPADVFVNLTVITCAAAAAFAARYTEMKGYKMWTPRL